MKTIGLIGGMSWESSAEYYRIMNELVRERLGGQHSADILMYSIDFAGLETLQRENHWDEAAQMMVEAARRLERGGADLILIGANTMHKAAPAVRSAVHLPLVHIASATAERVRAAGIRRIGLLGTRYTMEHEFYKGILIHDFDLDVILPDKADRDEIHRVIYDELCLGRIEPSSRQTYARIMADLVNRGAEGIILGCTEIMLLVRPEDASVPLFDTTRIHAERAVEMALAPELTQTVR
jgi:aspartate racemase